MINTHMHAEPHIPVGLCFRLGNIQYTWQQWQVNHKFRCMYTGRKRPWPCCTVGHVWLVESVPVRLCYTDSRSGFSTSHLSQPESIKSWQGGMDPEVTTKISQEVWLVTWNIYLIPCIMYTIHILYACGFRLVVWLDEEIIDGPEM